MRQWWGGLGGRSGLAGRICDLWRRELCSSSVKSKLLGTWQHRCLAYSKNAEKMRGSGSFPRYKPFSGKENTPIRDGTVRPKWTPQPKIWPQHNSDPRFGRRFEQPRTKQTRRIRAQSPQVAGKTAIDRKSQVVKMDLWEEAALSHTSGLQILFLGTGTGGPSEQRRSGSLAMKLSKTCWLFDCGEDTQRQVHRQPLVKNGKVERIFITNIRPENLLGLPGMLCTMSGSREIGLDSSDVPLHIYGPPGLADFIRQMLKLSDTFISMPTFVHEFVDHAVEPAQMAPQQIDRRSCLYRVLLPPDRLNPLGYYDGKSTMFLSRSKRSTLKMAKGEDARLNFRDLPLPPKGDPSANNSMEELTWTICTSAEHMITACRVPAKIDTWAYVWQEADRVGRLDPELCDRLNVRPHERGFLKMGMSVRATDGDIIEPSQVLGDDIKGRKVAIVGETNHSTSLNRHLKQSDVIVHAASCRDSRNRTEAQRACIDQAAALVAMTEASHLILYKFKPDGTPTETFDPASYNKLDGIQKKSGSLNYENGPVMLRKESAGGYLWFNKHAKQTVASPAYVLQSAENFATSIIGRQHCVSLADDMDLFSVERNIPAKGT